MAISKIQNETFNQLFKAAKNGQLLLGEFNIKDAPGKSIAVVCIGWEVQPDFFEVVPVAALMGAVDVSQLIPPPNAAFAQEVI